jgi:hypothetical protein
MAWLSAGLAFAFVGDVPVSVEIRPIRLRKVALTKLSSSVSASPIAVPGPQSSFPVLRSPLSHPRAFAPALPVPSVIVEALAPVPHSFAVGLADSVDSYLNFAAPSSIADFHRDRHAHSSNLTYFCTMHLSSVFLNSHTQTPELLRGIGNRFEQMRGHLLAFDILTFVEKRNHLEPGFRGGPSNVFHHGVQRAERVALPLFGNETEEPMLDRIPLRGAGRIVANRHGDAVAPDNGFMKAVLPIVRPVTIAASTVT